MNLVEKIRIIFILFFTLIVTGVLFAPASYALEVAINEKATVQDDVILLRDIASFSPEADPRVPALGELELGAAPYPGQTLTLNARYLISHLGLNITENDIKVKIPETLLVSRTAQVVDSDKIKRIFKNHILKSADWPAEDITFETISTPARLILPEGRLDWEIRDRSGDNHIGNVHLVVVFRVDGKPVRKVSVSGRVRIRQMVIRAARNLRPGDLIENKDISSSSEEMDYLPKETLNNRNEIIGKRAVRSIRENQLITAGMVEDPPVVEKGSRVLIKAESDRILITTIGKVLEDGRNGDLVKVVNISSGKEIYATVKGPELVVVSF